jgi:hypothetical protein
MFTWSQVMVEEERYRDRVRKAERKQQLPTSTKPVETKPERNEQACLTTTSTTSQAAA